MEGTVHLKWFNGESEIYMIGDKRIKGITKIINSKSVRPIRYHIYIKEDQELDILTIRSFNNWVTNHLEKCLSSIHRPTIKEIV